MLRVDAGHVSGGFLGLLIFPVGHEIDLFLCFYQTHYAVHGVASGTGVSRSFTYTSSKGLSWRISMRPSRASSRQARRVLARADRRLSPPDHSNGKSLLKPLQSEMRPSMRSNRSRASSMR